MKINIITQPLFSNYGGILQNYALQEVLRREGCDVLTVNVPMKEIVGRPGWKAYVRGLLNRINRIRGCYDYPFTNPHTFARKERELSFPQREFIARYISKVDCNVPFTSDVCKAYPADLWIVGSDQIWRPWCAPNIKNSFFDFLDDKTRRIAYAASFGTDKWEISPEITPEIRNLAKKFTAISVREESGVRLCREQLGVEATHLLDPTLLLTAEDYLALTTSDDHPDKKYIATYVLDSNPDKKQVIKKETEKYGLPEVKVGQMHHDRFDSIESWLATLAYAQKVITDSFHGTVFSIIFGKPVKVLKNGVRGNARLESLISMLGLKPDKDGYYYITDRIDKRLKDLRNQSINFIHKALS